MMKISLKLLKTLFKRGFKVWVMFAILGIVLSIYNFTAILIGGLTGSGLFTALLLILGFLGGIVFLGWLSSRLWKWK